MPPARKEVPLRPEPRRPPSKAPASATALVVPRRAPLSAVLLVVGSLLVGCGGEEPGGRADRAPPGTLFEVWERARAAVRASPDHLPARAERLVEAGDAPALHRLVREEIAVVPPAEAGFPGDRAVTATRWGVRATLRGGAGTPREKAELLAELLRRAGHEAEMMRAVPEEEVDLRELVLRRPGRSFEPDVGEAELAAWRAVLGGDPGGPDVAGERREPRGGMAQENRRPRAVDPGLEATRELADRIEAALPEGLDRQTPFRAEPGGRLPLVRAVVDGEVRWANPLVPGADFGERATREDPVPAGSPDAPPPVRIELDAAASDDPLERFTLLEARWRADEVAGRRIEIGFVPTVSPGRLAYTPVEDVETLVPTARVTGSGLAPARADSLSVVGDPVTVGGERLTLEDGASAVDGRPLAGPTAPEALASVAKLDVAADPAAWPRVELRVRALDAGGEPVEGLGADAFRLWDGEVKRSGVMTRNAAPPPRVLLLLDRSTSVPEAFREEGMARVARALADRLLARATDARLRVGTVLSGVSYQGGWTDDPEALERQITGEEVGNSDFWQALAEVAEDGPGAVILVTDAVQDPGRAPTPEERERIANGPPVLALGVGEVAGDTLAEMAAITGGRALPVADREEAVAAATSFLEDRRTAGYRIRYRAPASGADRSAAAPGDDPSGDTPSSAPPDTARRTVRLALDGGRLEAAEDYRPPGRASRPRRLSGLYLTLGVGRHSLTRTLAGYDGGFAVNPEITDRMLDEVEGMLFGRVVVQVEGPGPSLSVRLDDWLSAKLALRPLAEAAASGDRGAIVTALGKGVSLPPPEVLLLAGALPPPPEGTVVHPRGPQLVTLVERPVWGEGRVRTLDLFPFSRVRGVAEEPGDAWRAGLEASAYRAVAEEVMVGEGTRSLLAAEPLVALDADTRRERLGGFPSGLRYRWERLVDPYEHSGPHTMLIPGDGEPEAFWVVDRFTGQATGVLADGTGGARQEIEADLKRTETIIGLANLVGSLVAGAPFGVWAELEKTKARLVARATITLATGVVPDNLDDIAGDLACSMAKTGMGSAVPALGTLFDYEGKIGLAGDLAGTPAPSLPCPF